MKNKMGHLLMYRPAELLMEIDGKKDIYHLAKDSNIIHTYAYGVIKMFEKYGLATTTEKGRRRIAELTPKGEKVYNHLMKIHYILSK